MSMLIRLPRRARSSRKVPVDITTRGDNPFSSWSKRVFSGYIEGSKIPGEGDAIEFEYNHGIYTATCRAYVVKAFLVLGEEAWRIEVDNIAVIDETYEIDGPKC